MAVPCRPPCPAPYPARPRQASRKNSRGWVSRRGKLNFRDSRGIRALLRAVIPSPSLDIAPTLPLAPPGPCQQPEFKLQLSGAAQRRAGARCSCSSCVTILQPQVPVSPSPTCCLASALQHQARMGWGSQVLL